MKERENLHEKTDKEVWIVEWLIWTATLNVIGLLDHR